MKQSFSERFWFWICDTFGHAKSGSCNAEWSYNGLRHYHCTRCTRIVSTKITNVDEHGYTCPWCLKSFTEKEMIATSGKIPHDCGHKYE